MASVGVTSVADLASSDGSSVVDGVDSRSESVRSFLTAGGGDEGGSSGSSLLGDDRTGELRTNIASPSSTESKVV